MTHERALTAMGGGVLRGQPPEPAPLPACSPLASILAAVPRHLRAVAGQVRLDLSRAHIRRRFVRHPQDSAGAVGCLTEHERQPAWARVDGFGDVRSRPDRPR